MKGLYNHKIGPPEITQGLKMPAPNFKTGEEVNTGKYTPLKNTIDSYIGEIGKSQLKKSNAYDGFINGVYKTIDDSVGQKEKIGFDKATKLFEELYLANVYDRISKKVLDGKNKVIGEKTGLREETISRKINQYGINQEGYKIPESDSSKVIENAILNSISENKYSMPESMYKGLKDSSKEIAKKASEEIKIATTSEDAIAQMAQELSKEDHKTAMNVFKAIYTGFALERFYGDKKKAAKDLGVSTKTVSRRSIDEFLKKGERKNNIEDKLAA